MSALTLAVVVGAIAILIFCSALFSRVQTALSLLKPHQLRRLEENHAGLTNFIQIFRENPRRVLNVLLLGDGLVNVLLVILCLFFLWEGPLAGRVPQWLVGILIFAIVVLLIRLAGVPRTVAEPLLKMAPPKAFPPFPSAPPMPPVAKERRVSPVGGRSAACASTLPAGRQSSRSRFSASPGGRCTACWPT